MLAFFGVVADLLAQSVRFLDSGRALDIKLFLRVLEDGGEMIVGSLMLAQSLKIFHRLAPGGPEHIVRPPEPQTTEMGDGSEAVHPAGRN